MNYIKKILMSDCILVINENNYIGSSTRSEIDFAINHNIPVFYLHEV